MSRERTKIDDVDPQHATTLDVFTEPGGDLLLLRMTLEDPQHAVVPQLDMFIDEERARTLFNFLGVWLHTR